MLNINGNIDDAYYRYKMPKLIVSRENKNGGSIIITNIIDVAISLERDISDIEKYFRKHLSTNVKIEKTKGLVIRSSDVSIVRLQELLSQYIQENVLCEKCGNPETDISFDSDPKNKKNKVMVLNCKACGGISYK